MKTPIGFIGLGAMGMPMAINLIQAGHCVCGWDLLESARNAFKDADGKTASCENDAISLPVVLLSLPHSEILVEYAHKVLLPQAKQNQIFVDFTTVIPNQARQLAEAFAERGANYLDCPVTGGPDGTKQRVLRIFAGGDAMAYQRIAPVLAATTTADHVFYCGESGCGQIVKGVNQLGMGLINAAAMEALNYGIASGISPELLDKAIGGENGFRGILSRFCQYIAQNQASQVPIKYDQFDFFLNEAHRQGFPLPIVNFLNEILHNEPFTIRDANQMAPSYWDYLNPDHPKSRS